MSYKIVNRYLILRHLGWRCVIKTNLILKSRFGDSRLFPSPATPGHLATADQLTTGGPPWFEGGHDMRADTHVTHVTHVTLTRHDMPPECFVRSAKAHDLFYRALCFGTLCLLVSLRVRVNGCAPLKNKELISSPRSCSSLTVTSIYNNIANNILPLYDACVCIGNRGVNFKHNGTIV